jgi:hypothetical protein
MARILLQKRRDLTSTHMDGKCAGGVSPWNLARRVDAGENASLPLRQTHMGGLLCAYFFSQ